jgi:uncharacterized protein YdcH (DUF465 family)
MFENDKATVDELLQHDNSFRRLYDKHSMLNEQVDEINAGDAAMEQLRLEALKKEKLLLADQMQHIIHARHG